MTADFSKIINDAIRITKSNKRLWVFGLVLASLGAGGGSGSGGNFGNFTQQLQKQAPDTTIEQQQAPGVESAQTSVLAATATSLTDLVATIPYTFYAALATLLVLCIVLFSAVAIYGQAWAQSGLVHGIAHDQAGEVLTLTAMSDKGKLAATEVIKLKIIPVLALIGVIGISALLILSPALLLGEAGQVIAVVLGSVWLVGVVVACIVVAASINLGVLAVNLDATTWKVGFRKGFTIFRRFFMDVFIMSIITCLAGCVFGVAALIGLAILGAIGVAAIAGAVAFPPFIVVASPIVFVALLALILFMGLIGAISAVFSQATWVLLYKQLTEVPNGN
jgi:hypothetical protein